MGNTTLTIMLCSFIYTILWCTV